MNIVRKAMLHACWQDENERGLHAARPWLRLLLTGVVGIEHIPARESEGIQNGKKQWLAIRKEAGLRIDPETDEVMWNYRQTLDPYGIGLYIPEEFESIGREYFARSPGSDIWVWFNDLPDAVYDRLWERLRPGHQRLPFDEPPF